MARDLYRTVRRIVAHYGRRRKAALWPVIEDSRNADSQFNLAELMKKACGVVDSGIHDLASNPRHLAGFGRDAPKLT
jgi:hypothetical protein